MKSKIMFAAVAALLASTAPASAAVFNWTYTGTITSGGAAVNSAGTITTTDTTSTVAGRQAYTVTGITGTRNGVDITGLAPAFPTIFGGADNFLFVTGLPFTDLGVSFSLANGTFANLFLDDVSTGEYFATNLAGSTGRTNAIGVFTYSAANAAVPEPATWAMMLLGFGAMGYAVRRRGKVDARIRFA